MIYRVINPTLSNPDAAYPMVVAAVVPSGLRGLVLAAILSAIMSTVSGLVNSTSTLVTSTWCVPTSDAIGARNASCESAAGPAPLPY